MGARNYFGTLGYEMLLEINLAKYLLNLINIDLVRDRDDSKARMQRINDTWTNSIQAHVIKAEIELSMTEAGDPEKSRPNVANIYTEKQNPKKIPLMLLHG